MRALNIAATGMDARQIEVEVIANNISNIDTTAFKRQLLATSDLLYQDIKRAGVKTSETDTILPTGVQVGLGTKVAAIYRINEQGELTQTNNTLDLAIQGKGFFRIERPDGTDAYSRAGNFQLSPQGEIVTLKGYRVSPGITIPDNATGITINESGNVQVNIPGQQATQDLGQLDLTTFINPSGLRALGDNLFEETDASGAPIEGLPGVDGLGTLLQGYLENSNVDPIGSVTKLITAQRGYELNSKVIQAADEMLQIAGQARR